MPSIRNLTLDYNKLNAQGTFSEGDTITGCVKLDLEKDTKVESFFIKAKGDANVHWTERRNDRTYTYSAHRRFFKVKQFFIPEHAKDTIIPQGTHVYQFSLTIPQGGMPSSFRGAHGKIVYKLVAKLPRSWRLDKDVERELNFVSKSYRLSGQMMAPHAGSTKKELGFFSRGSVHMDATINKSGFTPGEKAEIVANIKNSSSKDMTPKFALKRKVEFHARGKSRYSSDVVCKANGDEIPARAEKSVRCSMVIPSNASMTINNCDIIAVHYQIKVYLDISFSSDPEVKFPVVIMPPGMGAAPHFGGAAGPGGPGNSDFPAPSMPYGPYPSPTHPHPQGYAVAPGPSNSGYPGYPALPTAQAAYQPPVYPGQPGMYPAMPGAPVYQPPGSGTALHPPPPPALFHPQPSAPSAPYAPTSAPPSAPPLFDPSASAPVYNPSLNASMMDMDFLSAGEAPPSYDSLFSSSSPAPLSTPTEPEEKKEAL